MVLVRLVTGGVRKLLHGISLVGNNVLLLATYTVLGILYTPTRIFDPLHERLGRADTYWLDRRPVPDDIDRHYHQF